MIGTTLHHDRILRAIGKGGMGEVYAAEDTKLHREVALKMLPRDMASDPERLQRFEREAQAVAAQFPSLDPEGKWVVYSGLDAGRRHIFMQSVGGQNPFLLTKDPTADDDEPTFSRSGEQIAFRSNREGGGLFIMGRTGENVKKISGTGYNPTWSPDGTKLMYGP